MKIEIDVSALLEEIVLIRQALQAIAEPKKTSEPETPKKAASRVKKTPEPVLATIETPVPLEPAPAPLEAVTLDHVRTVLSRIIQAGKMEAVRELIKSYGVGKIGEVAPEHYADIIQKAEQL